MVHRQFCKNCQPHPLMYFCLSGASKYGLPNYAACRMLAVNVKFLSVQHCKLLSILLAVFVYLSGTFVEIQYGNGTRYSSWVKQSRYHVCVHLQALFLPEKLTYINKAYKVKDMKWINVNKQLIPTVG